MKHYIWMPEPRVSKMCVEPRFIHQQTFLQSQLRAKGWLSTADLAVDRRPAFACIGVRLKPEETQDQWTQRSAVDQREGKTFPPCVLSEPISVSKRAQPDPVLQGPGDSGCSAGGLGQSPPPLPRTSVQTTVLTGRPQRTQQTCPCSCLPLFMACTQDPAPSQRLPTVTLGSCADQSSLSLPPGHGWGVLLLCAC